MDSNTPWHVNQYKKRFENADHWKFRRAFLNANKNEYSEDRLVTLSHMFIFIEFMGCIYSKPSMDLIEDLSKNFVNDLREKLSKDVQKKNITDLIPANDNGNTQANTPDVLNVNQPLNNNMRYKTPFDSNCLIPGFVLKVSNGAPAYDILLHSCNFSKIRKPQIECEHLHVRHVQARLYLQNKLIAVGAGTTVKNATRDVSIIAYNILKEMCFTIKMKDMIHNQISLEDLNNSKNEVPDSSTNHDKTTDNNLGSMILKNMGWKEGDGLGKNNQGIKSPIEVVKLKRRSGLGVASEKTEKISLQELYIEVKKHIMRFLDGPKTKLSFTSEFTKAERTFIHKICVKFGLKTRSYGNKRNRYVVIMKQKTAWEVFDELINSVNFENECYKLELPQHERNTYQ